MKPFIKRAFVLTAGWIGVILTLFGSVLAVVNGIAMVVAYSIVYGAGLLTILAGIVLFVTFIAGIVSLATESARAFLASAVMSLISSITVACCLGVPFNYSGIYVMSVLAALFGFAAFLLFTTVYVNTPTNNYRTYGKCSENEVKTEMKNFGNKLFDGEIEDEEYSQDSRQLVDSRDGYLKNSAETGVATTATKKKKRKAFLIPIAVMAAIFIVVIPSVFFGTCNFAYNGLLKEMSDMHEWYCGCYTSFRTYNNLLPDYYKDVHFIREEMEYYDVRACMSAILGMESRSGIYARSAYKRLVELQAADSRWGFDSTLCEGYALIANARWQGEGVYFQIFYDEDSGRWIMDSNVPSIVDGAGLFDYRLDVYSKDGAYYVGYYDGPFNGLNPCFRISDFDYCAEKSEFSISLYSHKDGNTYLMTVKENYEWSDLNQSRLPSLTDNKYIKDRE